MIDPGPSQPLGRHRALSRMAQSFFAWAPLPHPRVDYRDGLGLRLKQDPWERKAFDVEAGFAARNKTSQEFRRRRLLWLPSSGALV